MIEFIRDRLKNDDLDSIEYAKVLSVWEEDTYRIYLIIAITKNGLNLYRTVSEYMESFQALHLIYI